VKGWDGVTSVEDYWGDLSENANVEDVTLKMLVNGNPIFHDEVYEATLENRVIKGYNEIVMKKTSIHYGDDDDGRQKIKNKQAIFEFLYNYNQRIGHPCCVVSFEYDPILGIAMTVVIY
jgi:hypothetical protein